MTRVSACVMVAFLMQCVWFVRPLEAAVSRRGVSIVVGRDIEFGNPESEAAVLQYLSRNGFTAVTLFGVFNYNEESATPAAFAHLKSFVWKARSTVYGGNGSNVTRRALRFVELGLDQTELESVVPHRLGGLLTRYQSSARSDEQIDGVVFHVSGVVSEASCSNATSAAMLSRALVATQSVPARLDPVNATWSSFYRAARIAWDATATNCNATRYLWHELGGGQALDYLFLWPVGTASTYNVTVSLWPAVRAAVADVVVSTSARVVMSLDPSQWDGFDQVGGTLALARAETGFASHFDDAFPSLWNATVLNGFQYDDFAVLVMGGYDRPDAPWVLLRAGLSYTSIAWCPTYKNHSSGCQNETYVDLGHDAVFVDLFGSSVEDIAALKRRQVPSAPPSSAAIGNATAISSLPDRIIICYFSGGTWEDWRPDAGNFSNATRGNPDGGWGGEYWFNITNQTVRERLRAPMAWRVEYAQRKGCDAVQSDNMNCWTSKTCCGADVAYTPAASAAQITYNTWMADTVHAHGMSIGLINDLNQVQPLDSAFDFAIDESCVVWSTCSELVPYLSRDMAVFHVEYALSNAAACALQSNTTLGNSMSTLTASGALWEACPTSVLAPTRGQQDEPWSHLH